MKHQTPKLGTLRRGAILRSGTRAVAVAAVFSIAGATAAGAVTLNEAVKTAVETNPDVGVVATDRRAIDKELRQAWALYMPSLDARFAVGPEWTEQVAGNLPGRTGRLLRQEQSLTLTQLLFDGFAAASEVQRQEARVDSAALRVVETSEFIGLDAIQAYLDVLRQSRTPGPGRGQPAHTRTEPFRHEAAASGRDRQHGRRPAVGIAPGAGHRHRLRAARRPR